MPLVINTLWDYRQDFDGIFPGLKESVGTAERSDPSPDLLWALLPGSLAQGKEPARAPHSHTRAGAASLCGVTEEDDRPGGPKDRDRPLLGQHNHLMRAQLSGWKASRLHPRQVIEHKSDAVTKAECEATGCTHYANGDRHTGEYMQGKRHGAGRLSFHSGERYIGEFERGNRQGEGRYYFTNGDCYVGPQKANQPDGIGYFYTKQINRWDQTEFRCGEYVRDVKIACDPPPDVENTSHNTTA